MDQTTGERDRNTLKGKTLRRQIFLRERDFKMLRPQAFDCGYHRAEWCPTNYNEIHKHITWHLLKHDDNAWKDDIFQSSREERALAKMPSWAKDLLPVVDDRERFMRQYISWLRYSKRLYNPRWQDWSWKIENDTVMIRYFQNKPWEVMGMGTLERDY